MAATTPRSVQLDGLLDRLSSQSQAIDRIMRELTWGDPELRMALDRPARSVIAERIPA